MERMAPNKDSMVEATGLSVMHRRMPILREINLTVPRGETVALMGPNGAGKSTLLKCLAGALRPNGGKVSWFGNVPMRVSGVRRQIGFVGHQTGLYAELTALENLVFAGRMHGVERLRERAVTLLTRAGLESIRDRTVGVLSQGVRRRLAIARALVHDPLLILLDEPFASLDVDGRGWLERLFDDWRRVGRTVCFASHDVEQSRDLADRIVWLDEGQIVASETMGRAQTCSLRSA